MALRSLARNRKQAPKKATVPLSQRIQQEEQLVQGNSKPSRHGAGKASAVSGGESRASGTARVQGAPSAPGAGEAAGVVRASRANEDAGAVNVSGSGEVAGVSGVAEAAGVADPAGGASLMSAAASVSADVAGIAKPAEGADVAEVAEPVKGSAAAGIAGSVEPVGGVGIAGSAEPAGGAGIVEPTGVAGSAEPAKSDETTNAADEPDAVKAAVNALEADGSFGASGESGASSKRDPNRSSRRAARKSSEEKRPVNKAKIVFRVALVVLALFVAAAALLSWNRWLRFDDAADLQGSWTVVDGANAITIDEGSIHLTDAEAYGYEIDTGSKTLTFTFSDLSGSARYRFSADRNQVAIQDGSYSFTTTLFDDLGWALVSFGCLITGQQQPSPAFDSSSLVLTREGTASTSAQDGAAASGETAEGQGSGQSSSGETTGEASGDQQASGEESGELSEEEQAAQEQAAQEQAAAEEEARQNELHVQDALDESGEGDKTAGSNAVSPEDLR